MWVRSDPSVQYMYMYGADNTLIQSPAKLQNSWRDTRKSDPVTIVMMICKHDHGIAVTVRQSGAWALG